MTDCRSRTGFTAATESALEWAEDLHAPDDDVLRGLRVNAAELGLPPIHLSRSEARFLELIVALVGGQRVVEIGTLAGYSAIHLARALPSDGHLWTFEVNPRHASVARNNIAAAGLDRRVTVIEGHAIETLSRIEAEGPFDVVFIDADKAAYDAYGRWAAQHLRRGGVVVADNALFFGRLTDTADTATPLLGEAVRVTAAEVAASAAVMRRFHQRVSQYFTSVCLPTHDGLLVGIKK